MQHHVRQHLRNSAMASSYTMHYCSKLLLLLAQLHVSLLQVNFIDTYHRSGLYPRTTFPAGLGEEGAGTVVEVGPGECSQP
jgi:hypothetical protein